MKNIFFNSSAPKSFVFILFGILMLFSFKMNAQICLDLPDIQGTPCMGTETTCDATPTGWTPYVGTPDLTETNAAPTGAAITNYIGMPVSSGTVGLFIESPGQITSVNSFQESWFTTLTGLTVGQQYTIPVEWQRIAVSTFSNGGNLRMGVGTTFQTYTVDPTAGGGWQTDQFTFTATATSMTFVMGMAAQGSNAAILIDAGNICSTIPPACNASVTAPALSASTLNNVCPATTADLTSITASNTPAGTSVTWHNATPASNANKIANANSVNAGTFYAAFYDGVNDCYSGVSGNGTTAVTVTINTPCCAAGDTPPAFN